MKNKFQEDVTKVNKTDSKYLKIVMRQIIIFPCHAQNCENVTTIL